ncbi:MAG: hypothetical protein AAFR61_00490 [Bacteroidota bacterium]
MKVTGTVTYVDISGGFWGIEGDDGQKYQPVDGLPAQYRKEGQRIEAKVSPSQGFSLFMWGRDVKINNIKELSA